MLKSATKGFIDPIFGVILILVLLAAGAFYALSSQIDRGLSDSEPFVTTIDYSTTTVATTTDSVSTSTATSTSDQ